MSQPAVDLVPLFAPSNVALLTIGGDAREPPLAPKIAQEAPFGEAEVSGLSNDRLGRWAMRACAAASSGGNVPFAGSTISDVRRP